MFRRTLSLCVASFCLAGSVACQPPAEGDGGSALDVVNPADHASLDPRVTETVQQLQDGSAADQVEAAEKAAALGEQALPAAEALCQLALNKDLPQRDAGLNALEKVHPKLFPHVRTIVTVADVSARAAAVAEIGKMGRDGRAALPVVKWYLKWNLDQGQPIAEYTRTLAAIAPESRDGRNLLADLVTYKTLEKERAHTVPAINAAAATALGEMATAEPAHRTEFVNALLPGLRGPGRLEAVRSLGKCGLEAHAAEAQVKALRYDSDSEVQQAVDETLTAIQGFVRAAEKIQALREPPDPKGLAQYAADKDDRYLQQLANERLRKIHPQVERLSLVLFQPRPSYQDPSSEMSAELNALTPISKEAGPWAAALVDRFATGQPTSTSYSDDGWEMHRAVYATLARMAPDAPDVRQSLLAVCQMHIDRRREPLDFDEVKTLPQYWTGGELVAIAADDPQVERALCGAATALTTAVRIHYSEYNADTAKLLKTVLGDLAELAKKRPQARKSIAAALVEVMRHRAISDALEAAFLACGAEAYAALKAEGLGGNQNFSGWEEHAVDILRKTRPERDESDAAMQFQVGDQVWLENGDWLLNVQVVEVLAGRYLVRTLTPNEDWVTPGLLHKPTLPVPQDGYQNGDAVDVLVRGQWLPARISGSPYGAYSVTVEGTGKAVQPSADEIRPRTATAGASAPAAGNDNGFPSHSPSTNRRRQK